MDWNIATILAIDGLANGSLYMLAAMGMVMVFCITRVVFIPFGDIAAFAALTMVAFQSGRMPPTVLLVLMFAVLATVVEATHLVKRGQLARLPRAVGIWLGLPAVPCAAAWFAAGRGEATYIYTLLSIALVVPIAPLVARIALQPIADASILSLLMVSLALHFLLAGLGLLFFGPEGSRTTPLVTGAVNIKDFTLTGQTIAIIVSAVVLCIVFYLLFERTITGKALRATAINRVGARLVGIRPARASMIAYTTASLVAGAIGLLISPVVTMYYDSGFVIGLKAFVAATIGGLVSYPLAAIGAIAVGLVESFAAYWTGTLKDVVVFALLIPVMMLRTIFARPTDLEEEEIDE